MTETVVTYQQPEGSIEATIEYLGNEEFDFYFKISRVKNGDYSNPEVEECMAMTDGENVVAFEGLPSMAERKAIYAILSGII